MEDDATPLTKPTVPRAKGSKRGSKGEHDAHATRNQCPLMGGFTPPVGSGLGGGIKLPEVGGVLVGCGTVAGGVGGGATKLPEVGGIADSPPVPAVPLETSTSPPFVMLPGEPALLGGGATKFPVATGSCTQAAT